MRSLHAPIVVVVLGFGLQARASDDLSLTIKLGPIAGAAGDERSITFNAAARTPAKLLDVQDGQVHSARGVPLTELLSRIKPPRAADTAILHFSNGMQVPVRLANKAEVRKIFIAFEHGDAMDVYSPSYPLVEGATIPCPKVVYSSSNEGFTIWRYTSQLSLVQLVTWKAQQAVLAQPSRQLPSHPGWQLYARHCQPCHGMGGQGAKRGPDFIGDLEAYRRVPPLAEAAPGEQLSLHDKVKGLRTGQMPTLSHVSNREITELWRWLHAVHRSATK